MFCAPKLHLNQSELQVLVVSHYVDQLLFFLAILKYSCTDVVMHFYIGMTNENKST